MKAVYDSSLRGAIGEEVYGARCVYLNVFNFFAALAHLHLDALTAKDLCFAGGHASFGHRNRFDHGFAVGKRFVENRFFFAHLKKEINAAGGRIRFSAATTGVEFGIVLGN